MSFKKILNSEKPREKALKNGFNSLSNNELIALFLRTGSKDCSVLITAQKLIEKAGGFSKLLNIERKEIMKVKGIGIAKAIELQATFEFVKRIKVFKTETEITKIKHPKDVYKFLEYEFENEKQEHFYVLLLNTKNEIINKTQLYQGTFREIVIDLRDIFSYALKNNSRKMICVHNHPSGNSNPSEQDIKTTSIIKDISYKLNVPLIDHVVFGKNEYFSIFLQKKFKVKNIKND